MPRRHSNTRRRHEPRGFSAEILGSVVDVNDRSHSVSAEKVDPLLTVGLYMRSLIAYRRDLATTAAHEGLPVRDLPAAIHLAPARLAGPVLAARIAKETKYQQSRDIYDREPPQQVVVDRLSRAINETAKGTLRSYPLLDVVGPTRRTVITEGQRSTVVYIEAQDQLRGANESPVIASLVKATHKVLELPLPPEHTAETGILVPVVAIDAPYGETTEWFNSHAHFGVPECIHPMPQLDLVQ